MAGGLARCVAKFGVHGERTLKQVYTQILQFASNARELAADTVPRKRRYRVAEAAGKRHDNAVSMIKGLIGHGAPP